MLLQQLVNGLALGAVYALIALGYTMVYGILELINFAHGEIYMIGAYLGILLLAFFTWVGFTQDHLLLSLFLVFICAALYCAAYGLTLERVAYRPLRQAHRLSPLISAIGMSIFLQNYVMLAQGTTDKVFPPLTSTFISNPVGMAATPTVGPENAPAVLPTPLKLLVIVRVEVVPDLLSTKSLFANEPVLTYRPAP
jgi:branched-subunit amino acid ABC-type transport system permease component